MNGINREILRIALPSILANITIPLVGMVDIAVAGHLPPLGGVTPATFIGGITVGSMFFDLLYWNFGFLRVSTGGLAAQAYGRGDRLDCARIFARAIVVALAFAALILAIQLPFAKLAAMVVGCTPEVKELALKYFFIRVWAAPATVSLMSFKGWFIGMQDSVSSMWTDLVVNGVNIAASILLARSIGFAGVALGTVIAQWTGFLFASGIVFFKYRGTFRGFGRSDFQEAFKRSELRSFFSLNTDLFVRSLCLTAIYIGFTGISAHFGDVLLACSAIMMKLLMVFSFFTDGFAYAGEALTGKYIGRRDPAMTRLSIKQVFIWSMSIAVGFIFIYWGTGEWMVRLMTSDEAVIEAGRAFLPWLMLMPPLGCAAFTWDGIYVGATASVPMRNSMIWSMVLFFGLWYAAAAVFKPVGAVSVHILLGAYFAHLVLRTIYLSVLYRRSVLVKVD